jgi:hypothetical protein
MKNDSQGSMRLTTVNSTTEDSGTENFTQTRESRPTNQQVLTPARWARVVLGVTAPFGHDHLPTVFA